MSKMQKNIMMCLVDNLKNGILFVTYLALNELYNF